MIRRLTWAFVAALAFLVVELFVVVVLRQSQLVSVWEVQFGFFWIAPMLILLAAAGAAGGTILLWLLERAEQPNARRLLTGLVGVAALVVAWGVGGGRHLASAPRRAGFALAVAFGVGLVTYTFAPKKARLLRTRPEAVALATALTILVLELVNRLVLVRLYPAFHLGLAVAALLLTSALTLPFIRSEPTSSASRARRWGPPLLLTVLVVAAAAVARPAATRLARFDNFRLVMLQAAPLGGQAVLAAARLAPPPPLADCTDDPSCLPDPATTTSKRSVDFRERSILLVTIDALRADHVHAYGYARNTTPNLDALAAEGALFTHAYAPTPHTSYSVTSLMTGKYMRPLLLQGAGADSDTWASVLKAYGFATAAFYPPAVFFIDPDRFVAFRDQYLGFDYRKVEFMEGDARVDQIAAYLREQPPGKRVFVWLHLFAPHEPYEAHSAHPFGERDIDRYDSEIAFADATLGRVVALMRQRERQAVVIVASDHGEEFGEHGGRYHGTTVYEEQVRVPLVVSAPGAVKPRRVTEVVQTIDLMPTVLAALDIPRPPRLRGRNIGALLAGTVEPGPGLALAETEDQALLAEGAERLVCQRKLGACQLFDVSKDARQLRDISGTDAARFRELRTRLRELSASHGRYEVRGLRAEGRGWPAAILRGISGDGDAAEDIATLLDDADPAIRRKAAELLFELRRPETAPSLRLALTRDEDTVVRNWVALALTRLDQGAPLVYELARSDDPRWRRLAALALAESGDKRGDGVLVAWWKDEAARDYSRSRELLAAFARIRSKDAVWPLTQSLGDVRLRPFIAETLAAIGDEAARVPLAKAFAAERYQSARIAVATALVDLGAEAEMAESLVRFLGVPDPLPGGLELARRAGILQNVGGPDERDRRRLEKQVSLGAKLQLVVPRGGNGRGVRVLLRVHAPERGGEVRIGAPFAALRYDRQGKPIKERKLPQIHPEHQVRIQVPKGGPREVHAVLPPSMDAKPGRPVQLVVFADGQVGVDALALVPLADELPPPPPKPWKPDSPPSGAGAPGEKEKAGQGAGSPDAGR